MYDHIPHLIDMDALLVNAHSALPNAPQVEPVAHFVRTRLAFASTLASVGRAFDRASTRVEPTVAKQCIPAS